MARPARSPVPAVLLPLLLVCLASPARPALAQRGLSADERRVITAVDRAVNINSGTMNFAGVREVGRLFAGRFEELGFRTRWVAVLLARMLKS